MVNTVEKLSERNLLDFQFNLIMNNKGSVSPINISNQNLVITVPADGLAPNSARPSAGTVLITKSYMIFLMLYFGQCSTLSNIISYIGQCY